MRVFPSIFPGVLTAGSAHAALLRARRRADLRTIHILTLRIADVETALTISIGGVETVLTITR